MIRTKPIVAVRAELGQSAASVLSESFELYTKTPRMAQVLWVGLGEKIDESVLGWYRHLEVIACPATGLDHIDLAECQRRGIKVLSLRDTDVLPSITATAEHTIGLILALVRKIPAAVQHVGAGGWDRTQFMGRELSGMKVAIIGFGRVGQQVLNRLSWFGVTETITDADIVTIHVDLNDTTRGMCNQEFFAAMKSGSYFINTSRGQVVDEDALLGALRMGQIAGAALDVVCGEPDQRNEKLWQFSVMHPDKLILTPHIGGYATEAIEKAEVALARRLVEELNGTTG